MSRTRTSGLGALCGVLFAAAPAASAAGVSVSYCEKLNDGGYALFAASERPDGDLAFGLAHWMADAQNAGLVGVAQRRRGEWIYQSMDWSSQPGRPCIAVIRISRHGARITPTPIDACDGGQGAGATVGDIRFPPSAYAGPSPKDPTDIYETGLGPKCDR